MAWEKKTRIQYAGANTWIFSTKNVQYASFATLGIDTTSPSRDNILFSWCWKKDQRHQGKWCLCKWIELSLPLSSRIWLFSPSLLKCRNIQLTLIFGLCIYCTLFVLQWCAAERTSWILIFDLISQVSKLSHKQADFLDQSVGVAIFAANGNEKKEWFWHQKILKVDTRNSKRWHQMYFCVVGNIS